jgi:hypothetical protein
MDGKAVKTGKKKKSGTCSSLSVLINADYDDKDIKGHWGLMTELTRLPTGPMELWLPGC